MDRRNSCVAGDVPVILIDSSESSPEVFTDITPKELPLSKKSSISVRAIKHRMKNVCVSKYLNDENNDNEVEFVSLKGSKSDSASNDKTEEVLVESTLKAEDLNKSWCIAQANINHLEDDACSSTFGNESKGDRNIQDRIDNASTSMYASTEKTEDKQHTFPTGFDVKMAISRAKQGIEVRNIDPMIAKERVLVLCKMVAQLLDEMSSTMLFLKADKTNLLLQSVAALKKKLEEISAETGRTALTESVNTELHFVTEFNREKVPATLEEEQALIDNRLQDLHRSLISRPSKEVKTEHPKELTVKLMSHQQHALAWLMWREEQKPAGGVLADGSGSGKTLTMISLIITTIAKKKSKGMMDDESNEEWAYSKTSLRHKGGTLVVCPASLVSKWEENINNRCKRGMLSVHVYHGRNREKVPEILAKYDVVITTYNTLVSGFKAKSILYKIHWERMTLDKPNIILDHQNQTSESVYGLIASKRWAFIDTPIQNNPMNFYSILKFLQLSPFDDVQVWKRWVANKNAAGRQRLETLMTTLILRRTKEELEAKSELECLPPKLIREVVVNLDSQEKLLYEAGFIYTRSVVERFLARRAEKNHTAELDKNTQFTKTQNRLLSSYAGVTERMISVVLLRLRQICGHPSLIHSELDQEFMKQTGIMQSENLDRNLLSHINSVITTNEQEIGIDRRVATNILTFSNPVFQPDSISSKVKMVLGTVKEILQKNDKLIIVSQWTSMLKIVESHLQSIKGATFSTVKGNAPIKGRQGIIDSFNAVDGNPKILLLSLTAGSVDLSLVGGNHLLLIDIHWNPQLEVQAQNWIYRLGQKKNIFIYKFICKDTIEQQIQILQEKKLEIAPNVLTGENFDAAELTFDDLKSLFAL